ncbi:hypothetical protein SAMN04487785_12055 [Dyella jiangningensis]|nr:hypothetical protein BDW41_108183 [Dyella sp. AtDHG13]SDL43320.1 hypothetical protein SAMN04487785_12055 [Dyella jiangningensis]
MDAFLQPDVVEGPRPVQRRHAGSRTCASAKPRTFARADAIANAFAGTSAIPGTRTFALRLLRSVVVYRDVCIARNEGDLPGPQLSEQVVDAR